MKNTKIKTDKLKYRTFTDYFSVNEFGDNILKLIYNIAIGSGPNRLFFVNIILLKNTHTICEVTNEFIHTHIFMTV